MPAAAPTTPP
jgi:predicted DNA-binding protein (UPF0278 family)